MRIKFSEMICSKPINLLIKFSIILLIGLCTVIESAGQHKKTNWLQDKKEFTGRWRVGVGIDVTEPSGADIQFYRLSKICTGAFSITKKLSFGISAGKEGVFLGKLIEKSNSSWKSGGTRLGLDLKLYIPVLLNPYIGFGVEGGSRNLNGALDFSPDIVGRFGVEQKILGIKLSTTSSLNATIFAEGKYNKCLNSDFTYFLPSIGLRIHFL